MPMIKELNLDNIGVLEEALGYTIDISNYYKRNYYTIDRLIIEVPIHKLESSKEQEQFLDAFYSLYMHGKEFPKNYMDEGDKKSIQIFGINLIQIAAFCWSTGFLIQDKMKRACVALGEVSYIQSLLNDALTSSCTVEENRKDTLKCKGEKV